MKHFEWTSFYMEFADALLPYRNNRAELIGKMKQVHEAAGVKYPPVDRNHAVNDIDPFTVFGMFNKGIRLSSRIALLTEIAKHFHISASVPKSFDGIPLLNNQSATFYHCDAAHCLEDILTLWDVFESALQLAKEDTLGNRTTFSEYYDAAIQQKGIRWNLSMGLFWIRPYFFINLDSTNRIFLCRPESTNSELAKTFEMLLHGMPGGSVYLRIRDTLFSAISSRSYFYESLPDFSAAAWRVNNDTPLESPEWFPSNYTPGFTVEKWKELLADAAVFPLHCLQIMKRMLDIGGQATCIELSEKYGENWNFYNNGSIGICRRIYKKTNCPIMPREEENSRWWPILYLGKYQDGGGRGVYIWRLRDELRTALEQTDLSHVPLYAGRVPLEEIPSESTNLPGNSAVSYTKQTFLSEVYLSSAQYDQLHALLRRRKNIILQGAPGVGKTFAAKRLAYAFMGEKDDSRLEMIQFHQSYSYEDFVMGYRPDGEGFALQTGIFYDFCEKARALPKDRPCFFLIDEINRGNLSRIFGELLLLIEAGHRGESVRLSCNKSTFSVPENVYIIGMMNTADRSLALIDYALRRRFGFFEMTPAFDSEGFRARLNSLAAPRLNAAIEVIRRLNEAISQDGTLGKGFCIGHSYFCDCEEYSDEWLRSVIEYDILPTLQEYWFDDESALRIWSEELRGVLA